MSDAMRISDAQVELCDDSLRKKAADEADRLCLCAECRSKGKRVSADTFCQDCATFFCEACFAALHAFYVMKGHQRASAKECAPTVFCVQHPRREATLFCVQDHALVCEVCFATSHKNHELSDPGKFLSQNLAPDVFGIVARIQRALGDNDTMMTSAGVAKASLAKAFQDTQQLIRSEFAKV
jgi:hypothetical protein